MIVGDKKLIELRDYYYEGSFIVTKKEQHLARGYCCNSGCRHCPFKETVNKGPKIVSLVPSWTETLLAAGANVVGCTHFCIHPKELVQKLQKVGGTKSVKLEQIEVLDPDFVILDKEENTKEVFKSLKAKTLCSHVTSLSALEKDLKIFSEELKLEKLSEYAQRVKSVLEAKKTIKLKDCKAIKWLTDSTLIDENKPLFYMIWKKPWMMVTNETYIGSAFHVLFGSHMLYDNKNGNAYPTLSKKEIPDNSTLLFSTEPYPFKKEAQALKNEFKHHSIGIVDGEAMSWFGLRSLRYLEEELLL